MKRRLAVTVAVSATVGSLAVGNAASLTLQSGRLTPFQTCIVTADPNPTTAEADTYADEAAPTTNPGGAAVLAIAPGGAWGMDMRSYIRFDLGQCSPAIPVSATVRLATLRLNLLTAPASRCQTLDAFAVSLAWSDTTLTWNNQPAGTAYDVPASGTRTSFAQVGAVGCTYGTVGAYVPWDVTADVRRWVAGTATNNGWMIRNDAEAARNITDYVDFVAQAAGQGQGQGQPIRAPQLIVTYVK